MISVIIPLYNKEPIIERSLQSVLSQDYDDFEVVVVNDGSTDRSADIVRSINDHASGSSSRRTAGRARHAIQAQRTQKANGFFSSMQTTSCCLGL